VAIWCDGGFRRGDLVVIWPRSSYQVGDHVAFTFPQENWKKVIVHRVVRLSKRQRLDGSWESVMLTKGDENAIDDRGLYPSPRQMLSEKEVFGRVVVHIPYIGHLRLLFDDYPITHVVLIALLILASDSKLRTIGFTWMLLVAAATSIGPS